MRFRTKFAFVAALAAAIVGVLTIAGGAAATVDGHGDATDPQATNVPYVAWAGEQIRFTKCYRWSDLFDNVDFARDSSIFGLSSLPIMAHYNVVNPLIDTPSSVTPTFEGGFLGTGNIVQWLDGYGFCAQGSFYSASPGLADILLNVTNLNGVTVAPKHDFIGIWMRMSPPTIAELPGGGDNGTGSFNLGSNDGETVAPGIVGVSVSGTFPFAGKTWTFPGTTDWSDLAHMLATDTNPVNTSPGDAYYRWDIHDNNALDKGHPNVSGCTAETPALNGSLDAVDNCAGDWKFSRILGYDYADDTPIGALLPDGSGPYDPIFPFTMLGNGVLDAYDVPMPAAQIDLTLTGGAGMAGPTGALEAADKTELYSRDGTGDSTAHNLYAPYYAMYIPATSRFPISSGIDGPANLNDASGFQTVGKYDLWEILNGVGGKGSNKCQLPDGSAVPLPASEEDQYLSGTVYTDEHGQAEVLYDPNAGFTLTPDANHRCTAFVVGPTTYTSAIKATAVYPYKKVAPAQTTAALTKTVSTASSKTLSCVPKGQYEAFCVETVKDPWGNPISSAKVKFTFDSSLKADMQADPGVVLGGFDTTGQGPAWSDFSESGVAARTNRLGEVGILVTDSANECLNIRAENVGTRWMVGEGQFQPGVSVSTMYNPFAGKPCSAAGVVSGGTVTTTTTTTTTTASNSSSNSSSNVAAAQDTTKNTAPVALGGSKPTIVTAAGKAKATATIKVAKFVIVGHTRYLGLQLKSTAKTAKVSIILVNAKGKVIGRVVKTVKTNRLVKVMKIGKSVHSVRVSPIVL
jgi:hypothetical protein